MEGCQQTADGSLAIDGVIGDSGAGAGTTRSGHGGLVDLFEGMALPNHEASRRTPQKSSRHG